MPTKQPEPVAKSLVCSVCGLAWDRHPKKAAIENCVELLKADLARRPLANIAWSGGQSVPFYGTVSAS